MKREGPAELRFVGNEVVNARSGDLIFSEGWLSCAEYSLVDWKDEEHPMAISKRDDKEEQAKLDYLRSAIQNGLKGPVHDGPSAMAELNKYIETLPASRRRNEKVPA